MCCKATAASAVSDSEMVASTMSFVASCEEPCACSGNRVDREGETATIGERFRDGTPVIMDLVEMSNADAKRLVDFAAGLAFALRGSFDKVATKVFLLSPADVDVSPQERRRIAETGFYSQQ